LPERLRGFIVGCVHCKLVKDDMAASSALAAETIVPAAATLIIIPTPQPEAEEETQEEVEGALPPVKQEVEVGQTWDNATKERYRMVAPDGTKIKQEEGLYP
jgi:hypothetical protein